MRSDVAMTGEITLRGRVLPIGGVREKTMAALRAGIHEVLLPEANISDLAELDPGVRAAVNFTAVSHMDSVLEKCLCPAVKNEPRPEPEAPGPCLPPEMGERPGLSLGQ